VDYETLVRSVGVEHVQVVDPWDREATEAAIKSGLHHPGPAVIIARRSCLLLPEEKSKEHVHYWIDTEGCIRCEECMDTGCPAVVWQEDIDRPAIREWECAGCSLCAQLCPTEAIMVVEAVSS
jgi:indolepyruvate ferredoxin oxidoreductase alpha subunit